MPWAAQDTDWNFVWGAETPPEAPWQREGFGTTGCVAQMEGDKLLIADRSTEGGSYAFFRCPCFLRPGDETVIEAQLKTNSGWSRS